MTSYSYAPIKFVRLQGVVPVSPKTFHAKSSKIVNKSSGVLRNFQSAYKDLLCTD